jgi:amidase
MMQGTDAWEPRLLPAHGDFASFFLSTGLVPMGKTQLSEFGFSASAEHPRLGPVRNPWDTDFTAAASSSGSAAFVAAGVVPIAHANDGGGSIRIPAACNGLVGLKPSRGRLPQDKLYRQMPVRIVSDGVLTRSVRDTAAFYREAERIWRNRRLEPIGAVTGPGSARLRIAVITQSVNRQAAPSVRDLTLQTAELLAGLGHSIEYLDQPPVPSYFLDDFLLYWALLAMQLVRTGRKTFGESFDKSKLDNLTLGLDRHASRNLHKLPIAITRLRRLRRVTARLYQTYDVLLMPTLADETPRIGHLDPTADYQQIIDRLIDWVAFTPLQNVTGEPAISLPLGQSASGMPVGMMLTGPIGHERRLLELAYELEAAKPWPRLGADTLI